MYKCLVHLGLIAVASCALVIEAKDAQGQRAGLVARAGIITPPPMSIKTAAPAVGGETMRRRTYLKRAVDDPSKDDPDAGWPEDEVLSPGESASEETSNTGNEKPKATGNGEMSKGHADAPPRGPDEPPAESKAANLGLGMNKEAEETVNKGTIATGTVAGDPPTETSAEGGSPFHEEAEEPEEPCEDEPFTVYVTVTVTPDNSEPEATPTTGGEEDCTEGCFTNTEDGSAEPTAVPIVPPEEEEEPEEEEPEFDDDPNAIPDTIESEVGSPIASASASGEAGFDDDFAGSPNRFRAIPVVVSLALCAATSLVAGLLFMGP